ncbi:MAG: MerC domain-containing protein [Verrucomicrobiota bacterium]|nr:MerC domain-containing protein [Verrucomicrobiota bacterium]
MKVQGYIEEGVASEVVGLYRPFYDRIGMVASSLCAVHCILMPWVIMVMPVVAGTVLTNVTAENVFVGVSICLAALCGFSGCRKHGQWLVMGVMGAGGLILMGARLTAPHLCHVEHINWSNALCSTWGGGLVAASHYLNLKYSRLLVPEQKAPCCHSDSCSAHDSEGK